ncbi:hypothetical protein PCO31110_04023 [Pandoraea communis]|uniref:Tyrosine specific protein phosphatases domain-containing protein n=1 Tax=Pandoraea communis TaxID=2508297 RepID=A0A5E4XN08_9BURK|nr:hypothetical protein [Pandoraea communis]VVE37670.1 hypothetical protein PCO31110_04023 [Pandoraea communis]
MPRSSHRSKNLVTLLYKPQPGPRRVLAMSRADAERLPAIPTVAVISITAPERPPAKLSDFRNVLRLSFSDVDHLNPAISTRAREKLANAFTLRQADEIRAFVEGLPTSIESIVVHCEGGYSRSCAVALGLHRLYGYQVDIEAMTHANPSVVQLITTLHIGM